MYYTQSTFCQGGFLNKFFSSSSWAYAGFAKGGQLLFGGGGLVMRGLATRLLGGFGSMLSRKKKNLMVQFGAFWSIFSYFFLLSKSLKMSFLYKNNYKL